jgi:hypothetical protein
MKSLTSLNEGQPSREIKQKMEGLNVKLEKLPII